MKRDDVINEYFEWMYDLVCSGKKFKTTSYRKLLGYLYDRDFTFSIAMDGSRAEDGMELRYRFAHERNHPYPVIAEYLDDRPCSVLEMMVALAIRCEEHIMDDPDIGNRTTEWFWVMLESLRLDIYDDRTYSKHIPLVEKSVDIFLDRRYDRNGSGGLFTIPNSRLDMRTIEIWYQMCWYLDSIMDN